jgi:hypothetical protein
MHPKAKPPAAKLDAGLHLDALLHEIGELDAALVRSEDLIEMEAPVLRRAGLFERLPAVIAALQAEGRRPDDRQVRALHQAGIASLDLLRRAVLARHQVATEMMQLHQEQRLTDFMGPVAGPQRRLNLDA